LVRNNLLSKELSIIIPAYNEENGIGKVIDRIQKTFPNDDIEIIVVDDSSTDKTATIAERMGAKVVRHLSNKGYGAALKTGFRCAQGSFIAFLDADNTYPPEVLPAMLQKARKGYEMVVGTRMQSSRMPLKYKIGIKIFNLVVKIYTGKSTGDATSGLRVLRKTVATKLEHLPSGLNFSPAMTVEALLQGLSYTEVSIKCEERVGSSKLKVLRDGWGFLQAILTTRAKRMYEKH